MLKMMILFNINMATMLFILILGHLLTGALIIVYAFMILKNNYTEKVKQNYTALLIVCIIIFIGATAYGFPDNIRILFASLIGANCLFVD
ncbi:hypothetical protein Desde_1523 [Desulfitobacterium dehalogenans ATCC 51507]|uniref:Uncharacterized protein n=1 Tax=Desulfitobacterium dehalogenans (strain ATCC 51507 / DSM 9161 / JW/IU-DC1) TaxID=756499 RepID=I4A7J9_DESDJ|nr:hypothetical protein [Desulfitobacterium dehalogenans]AFL99933.1 hypothetical protein Desde_1523 [Desulfitobacterium dehalogenans ATCC 51507]